MLYGLLAEVIERVTGQSYGTFIADRIFKPLDMTKTTVKLDDPTPEKYAKAYMPMDDGDFVDIARPSTGDGSMQAGAGGVRSSLRDLLTYYDAILTSRGDPSCASPKHRIKGASRMTAGHTFLSENSALEKSYALGLLRTQLPGTFGDVGPNPGLVEMPVIGRGDPSRLILFHQGSYPGVLSSVFMVPEEEVVIVVLTNSLSLNDAADWIGQLLLEHTIDTTHKTDFIDLASKSKDAYLNSFRDAEVEYNAGRLTVSSSSLERYVGNYWNNVHTFLIKIYLEDSALKMSWQGSNDAVDNYDLLPYKEDIFSWYTSREDQARRGRWPIQAGDYFNFLFSPGKDGNIAQLVWNMDGPIVFRKESADYPLQNTLGKEKI